MGMHSSMTDKDIISPITLRWTREIRQLNQKFSI